MGLLVYHCSRGRRGCGDLRGVGFPVVLFHDILAHLRTHRPRGAPVTASSAEMYLALGSLEAGRRGERATGREGERKEKGERERKNEGEGE